MADPTPLTGWARTYTAVETAAVLAPIGGKPTPGPGSLGSRIKYMIRLIFSSRQKRYNMETSVALRGIADTLSEFQYSMAGELAALRADLKALRQHADTMNAMHAPRLGRLERTVDDVASRVTHTEQCVREYRDMIDDLEGRSETDRAGYIGPRKHAG